MTDFLHLCSGQRIKGQTEGSKKGADGRNPAHQGTDGRERFGGLYGSGTVIAEPGKHLQQEEASDGSAELLGHG